MEYRHRDDRPHSNLMLATRITLPHFSVSSAMNFSNSAGAIDIGTAPKSASRDLNFGSPRMSAMGHSLPGLLSQADKSAANDKLFIVFLSSTWRFDVLAMANSPG
jgi:hypothetical protein